MKKFYICHRLHERTFKIGKWYFPVCSRCTGIYLGMILGFALISIVHFKLNY